MPLPETCKPVEVAEGVSARGGLHVLKMLEHEPESTQPS